MAAALAIHYCSGGPQCIGPWRRCALNSTVAVTPGVLFVGGGGCGHSVAAIIDPQGFKELGGYVSGGIHYMYEYL